MEEHSLMHKISIIGQGYVGLTISAFASDHFKVLGFDSNSKIEIKRSDINYKIQYLTVFLVTILFKFQNSSKFIFHFLNNIK
jgi:UDP-N-acetyl-D-mannosaminuronate dehydrogenase